MVAGLRKLHRETGGAEVMPKLLAKQRLNVRLIVNHENEEVHGRSLDLAMVAAVRSKMNRGPFCTECDSPKVL
jgi:hypothetical protein